MSRPLRAQVRKLSMEVERLRARLRSAGIDPDKGSDDPPLPVSEPELGLAPPEPELLSDPSQIPS